VSDLKFEAVGVLGLGLLGALCTTIRIERVGAEHYLRFRREGKPVVFVFWHGQMLPLVHAHRGEGIVVLVSEHADGEYITQVIRRHGFGTVRGSSTRGATQGLRGLIREARAGRDLALTPDGPRGPAREFKAGALAVAQATGLPVIPLAVGATSAWRFSSWDGFMVPRPFSRVRIVYGEPRWVSRESGREALDGMAVELGGELDRLSAVAAVGDASS
jgi:lysophospholipid acyltransferase (LPLAT)-like uncharacterized protein